MGGKAAGRVEEGGGGGGGDSDVQIAFKEVESEAGPSRRRSGWKGRRGESRRGEAYGEGAGLRRSKVRARERQTWMFCAGA